MPLCAIASHSSRLCAKHNIHVFIIRNSPIRNPQSSIFVHRKYKALKGLRHLNVYFVRYKWHLLFGLLFVAISNIFAIWSPLVVRDAFDNVQTFFTRQNNGEAVDKPGILRQVAWYGVVLLILALLRGVFMFFMRQTLIVMSRHIEFDLKNDIYAKYQELDMSFYKVNKTGDLMSRISEDVSRVRMYAGPAIMYSMNLVVLTILVLYNMFMVNVQMAIWVIVPLPLLAITIYKVNSMIHRKSESIQAQLSNLTTLAQENYSGIRVVKSFVQESSVKRFFFTQSALYRDLSVNLSKTEAFYFPSMQLFIGLSTIITVLAGGKLVIDGTITTGNIAEFVIYLNLLTFPISSIGWVASMIQRASASQKRINEFLHVESQVADTGDVETAVKGEINFKDVSFAYPHSLVSALKHFSVHIPAGSRVAVIGRTGSGKSTIAQLLLRMYDVKDGVLKLDGVPVGAYPLAHLRNQISYVPQDVFLFSDTIFNNIAFGNHGLSMEQVQQAAKMAAIHDEIEKLPQGYQTVIGERGVTLSGGQKQRISIARALLKQAPVLIMDDCLSAVDTRTEVTITDNFDRQLKGVTTIVITHRIPIHMHFDKIIMLGDGTIIEEGTHAVLMEQKGPYYELYKRQMEVHDPLLES
jgi:ATP-binding cassette subfamily B protein